MTESSSFDIICFGDSLTAGYQSPSPDNPAGKETPYGEFLQTWLGPSVRVLVSGICGELTGEMTMRFRQDVLRHQPRHVIILGGTNDLGWGAHPAEIMRNLLKMYEASRAEGVIPVPVTVPSIRLNGDGGGDEETLLARLLAGRAQLNDLIRQYAEAKNIPWIDLSAATAEPSSGQLAKPYSNDGLHFTTAGYRVFARLLFDQVLSDAYKPGGTDDPRGH
jgi:lysophospholipase L1-like esterase